MKYRRYAIYFLAIMLIFFLSATPLNVYGSSRNNSIGDEPLDLYVEITSPSQGSMLGEEDLEDGLFVSWSADDSEGDIVSTHVELVGYEEKDVGTDNNVTFYDIPTDNHEIIVTVTSEDDSNTSDSVEFIIDRESPILTIESPEQNDDISSTNVIVNWTGDGGLSGIDEYNIRVGEEGDWTNVNDDTSYEFLDMNEGEHTAYVRATDNAGNSATENVTFTVDTTPPDIEMISPEDSEILADDTVMVEWIGSDETSGIDHYEVRINYGEWLNVSMETSYEFEDLSEGEHTAYVRATDNAGNSATENVTFTVDTTPPDIEIISPEDSEILDEDAVVIEWIGSDETSGIDRYEVSINYAGWLNVDMETSYQFQNLSDGEYTVIVRAIDNAGNSATDSVTLTIDTTSPDIEITSPEDSEILADDTVMVEWIGSDETSGIDHYEVRLDDESRINVGLETRYEFTGLSDGEHTVDVRATDKAGNSAMDSVTFIVDTTSPSIEITTPTDNDLFNTSDINVQWIGSDETSGIDYYEIKMNDGYWLNMGMETNYEITDLPDGEHTVIVRATDKAWNSATDRVTFTVDTTPPDIEVTTPTYDELFNVTDIKIEWIGSDETSGVYNYEIRINEDIWIDKNDETSHEFTDLSDGEHKVEIRAIDNAGNSRIESVDFTVDVTPPDITILNPPEDDSQISQSTHITIMWSGSDDISGIDYYEVRLNGGEWGETSTNSEHTYHGLFDGEHTVEIRAVDNAGNEQIETTTFEVDPGSPSELFTMRMILGGIIALAIIGLVTIVMIWKYLQEQRKFNKINTKSMNEISKMRPKKKLSLKKKES